jgi:hypothetical protein
VYNLKSFSELKKVFGDIESNGRLFRLHEVRIIKTATNPGKLYLFFI